MGVQSHRLFSLGLRGGTVESYDMVAESNDEYDVRYMDINRSDICILQAEFVS